MTATAGLDVAVSCLGSAAQLGGSDWDDMAGERDFFATTRWMGHMELSLPRRPLYLVGRPTSGGPAIAGLPCYAIDGDATILPQARPDDVILRRFAEAEWAGGAPPVAVPPTMPTLYCGSRQIGYSRLLRRPGVPAAMQQEAVHAVLAGAEAAGREMGAVSLSFLYVDADDLQLRRALCRHGFGEFFSASCWVLQVRWPDLEAYLESLGGRRAYKIRYDRRKIRAAGVEVGVRPLSPKLVDELATLNAHLLEKYGVPVMVEQIQTSLWRLLRQLGDRAVVAVAEQAGRVRGFALFVRHRDALYPLQLGFDYGFQGRLPLYFEVAFYAPIEHAIATGCTRIELGCGADQAKRSRGCREIRQFGYVKCLDPGVQRDLKAVLRLLAAPPPPVPAAGG